jgi:phosphatidylglycerol---prolipoprotein diacylglyceryl transferase
MYYESVNMYGLIIGVAVICAWEIATRWYGRLGGDKKEVERLGWGVILGGIVGARAYHVIDYWEFYQTRLVEILFLWNGGLGIWGGLVGGLVAFVVLQWHHDSVTKWRMLGAIVVSLPLAQAMGRVANYVNGEFLELVGVVPWWMAEGLLNLGLFGVMLYLSWRETTPKKLVGTYLLGYGLIRLFLESFREVKWEIGVWPVASYMALIAVIMGAWLIRNAQDSSATLKGKKT